jgi:hypothetical protein
MPQRQRLKMPSVPTWTTLCCKELYGSTPKNETRYSPSRIIGVRSEIIRGEPDPKHISTSYV